MKNVKIVIGANYGDEGKGLLTRHFVKESMTPHNDTLTIFHNGTAQRGHTVDYNENFRHVYHHFGSGTADGSPTYFADSFLVHPMEFEREYEELRAQGIIVPMCYCHPDAKVITPYDMLVDRLTQDHIEKITGNREYASCCFGSWCAIEDRFPMGRTCYTVKDFWNLKTTEFLLTEVWKDCKLILEKRGIDIANTKYANINTEVINRNFAYNMLYMINRCMLMTFDDIWKNNHFNTYVFENGQGLGLDVNIGNNYHTTSNTGLINPYNMLKNYKDFNAEVCYVTRSYLTRHGAGPMESRVPKSEINCLMIDKTNVPNEHQGTLRYGYLEDKDQKKRIDNDFKIARGDNRFSFSMAITHTNEFNCENDKSKYFSDNPYNVEERK